MTQIDPEQERRRLGQLYVTMSDEELDKLVAAADDLTDVARQALGKEIERRGGHLELTEEPPQPEPPHPQLLTVARVRDLEEAMLARGLLASAGIESFVADENLVRMNWFLSNVIGNLRLQVREEDAERAEEVLSQQVPEEFEIDSAEGFLQPKCPKCGSVDIHFEGASRPGADLGLALQPAAAARKKRMGMQSLRCPMAR